MATYRQLERFLHQIPFVGVLQLRADEFPEVEFRKGTDLLQLLWCAREQHSGRWDDSPSPVLYWRRLSGVRQPLQKVPPQPRAVSADSDVFLKNHDLQRRIDDLERFDTYPSDVRRELKRRTGFLSRLPKKLRDAHRQNPGGFKALQLLAREMIAELRSQLIVTGFADANYLPKPCRLFPERVVEHPWISNLPTSLLERLSNCDLTREVDLGDRLSRPEFTEGSVASALYERELSVADGTKVGGYTRWIQRDQTPECECGRSMDHLLTLASDECDGANWRRWLAQEDRRVWNKDHEAWTRVTCASGMMFGDGGSIYVFICRHCKEWPVRSLMQCC